MLKKIQIIKKLFEFLDGWIKKIDGLDFGSSKKIFFREVLLFSIIIITTKANVKGAHLEVIKQLKSQKSHFTYQGIHAASLNININHIIELNCDFIKFINKHAVPRYKKINKQIMMQFAIDGTQVSHSKRMGPIQNKELRKTITGAYKKCSQTFPFEINTSIVQTVAIDPYFDERSTLQRCLKDIPKGSLLIADRGYYKSSLACSLDKEGYKYIVRVPKNTFVFARREAPPKNYRLVAYTVKYSEKGSNSVISSRIKLITNLPENTFRDQTVGDLYHSRWKVEEFYKTLKSGLNCNIQCLKREESVNLRTQMQMFVSNFIAFIIALGDDSDPKYKYSPKYITDQIKDIFVDLLYHKSVAKIQRVFSLIWRHARVRIELNRHFPRKLVFSNFNKYNKCNKGPKYKIRIKLLEQPKESLDAINDTNFKPIKFKPIKFIPVKPVVVNKLAHSSKLKIKLSFAT